MDALLFDFTNKNFTRILGEEFSDFPIQFWEIPLTQNLTELSMLRKYSGVFVRTDGVSKAVHQFISDFRDFDEETPIVMILDKPQSETKAPPVHADFFGMESVNINDLNHFWTKKYIYKIFDDFELELARRPILQAVESSGESIVLTNLDGVITYVNPTFTEVTGYTPAEAIGQTPRLWKSGKHSKDFYQQMWRTILSGQKWSGELINRKKSGEDYHSRLSISPIKGPQQQLLGFAAIHTDITQFKNTEKELMNAQAQALSAAKVKMQFLANLSHELRTPLNAIYGTLELLKETQLSEGQHSHFDVLRTASSRLLRTISDLLDLAAIEESKLTINKVAFSPVDETKKTLYLFKNFASQKKIKLKLSFLRNVPKFIEGDPTRYGQILANFVSNALKYSPGGTVHVDLRILQSKYSKSLVIKVIDNGIGVKKSQQRKLFTRFSKLSEDSTELNGSGLGLAISRDLAELMGGNVGYKTRKPKGSVFWFSIPFETMMNQTSDRAITKDEPKKNRILVVEDDELSGRVLKGILNNMGHFVTLLEQSQNACKVIQSENFDFILMDCMMPHLNGYECTRMLRESGFDKPIIGMSANISPHNRDQCRLAGMNDFIAKPIEIKDLQRCLQTWLHEGQRRDCSKIPKSASSKRSDEIVAKHLKMLTDATSKRATEEIIRLFLKNTPTKILTLTDALDHANFNTIEQVAHQLKSSCGYLGLNLLQDTCEKLEQAAIKKENMELEKFKKALTIQYPRYSAFLNRYITPRKVKKSHASRLSN